MEKLKEIVFVQSDDIFKVVGIYVSYGAVHYQGEEVKDPEVKTLHESLSFWNTRSYGKKLAYNSSVPFTDLVSEPMSQAIAKLKKG